MWSTVACTSSSRVAGAGWWRWSVSWAEHCCPGPAAQPGPVFRSRRGGRLSARQVQLRLSAWVAQAGVGRFTPHIARHTFGTRLYRETLDLRRVQVALGHCSVETTQLYVAV